MRKPQWLTGVLLIATSAQCFAATQTSIVEQFQSQRQAFAQNSGIDLRVLSQDIQSSVRDSYALDQAGNDHEAIARLQTLQKYVPLEQFPSLDVQLLCERIYTKLSRPADAAGCHDRASAMAELLQRETGSGATPDDPVRVITIDEIGQWMRSRGAKIDHVSPYVYREQNLQAVTYSSAASAGVSAVAYFRFTPRLQEVFNHLTDDVFAPVTVSASNGTYQAAITQAHEQRVKFLNDTGFNYLALIQLCTVSTREALKLAQQGDFSAALAKLGEVGRVRPIEDIPIFDFISAYSFLLGKAGKTDEHNKARLYLFGITQDIARSGNGLTPESAVHVVAISEEYAWIHAKKMRVTRQSLIQKDDRRYDLLEAEGADNSKQTYYFEVSQLFARESAMSQ